MPIQRFEVPNLLDRDRVQPANRRAFYVFFAIVLAIGIFFRFANLDKKVYWNDEAITSLRVSGYTEAETIDRVYDRGPISVAEIMRYQHPNPEKGLNGTIDSLASEDAHLSLLYHVIARVWVNWFGSSIASVRSLSVWFGLMALPCLYWLCQELFRSQPQITGWVAMGLMAVSPFHVLYSQEARQYSLWTVAILLSGIALLKAMRVQTKMNWAIYAVSVALMVYSHTLSILVILAQGIYVFLVDRFRFFAYFVAAIAGLLAFVPWFVVAIARLSKITSNVSRTNIDISAIELMKRWGQSLNRIFVDIPHFGDYCFPIIFLLTIYAIYYLVRKTPKETFLFVLCSIGTVLFLAIPDIVLGGKRSADGRYLIPAYIGIELAIAYLFSTQIAALKFKQNLFWKAIAVIVLSGGIVSCTISSQSQAWWNKSSAFYNPEVAQIINQSSDPLVISDNDPGRIISLGYLLNNNVKLLLLSRLDSLTIPQEFKTVYVFQASTALLDRIEKEEQYHLELLLDTWLWRLDRDRDTIDRSIF